jgi:acyl carrier protein
MTSDTEQKLTEIWQDVLELSTVNVDQEFLDLGGDSLTAMMCISRTRKLFGVELSIEDFFMEHSTIAVFAQTIDENRAKTPSIGLNP